MSVEAELQAMFQTMADKLMDRDLDGVTEYKEFPIVIFQEDGVRVDGTSEENKKLLTAIRDAAGDAGTAKVVSEVMKIEKEMEGRSVLQVRWIFVGRDGATIDEWVFRPFVSRRGGDFVIEMMEVLETPFAPTKTYAASYIH